MLRVLDSVVRVVLWWMGHFIFNALCLLELQQQERNRCREMVHTNQAILLGDGATVQTSNPEASISELRALLPTRGNMEVMRRML